MLNMLMHFPLIKKEKKLIIVNLPLVINDIALEMKEQMTFCENYA